jgi:ABC-type lipoprotein release transport system permease subunit
VLKGIDVDSELAISDSLRHLKAGSLDRLRDSAADPPGIVLGARLVDDTGIVLNSNTWVVSPEGGPLTPAGPRQADRAPDSGLRCVNDVGHTPHPS